MSGTRPNIFDDAGESDIDLSSFAPKSASEKPPVPAETLERVSEEGGFPSRAPKPRAAPQPQPARRLSQPTTGRTVLLNARVTQRARDRFFDIVEAERLRYEAGEINRRATLGEIVERALAALDREMGQGGKTK